MLAPWPGVGPTLEEELSQPPGLSTAQLDLGQAFLAVDHSTDTLGSEIKAGLEGTFPHALPPLALDLMKLNSQAQGAGNQGRMSARSAISTGKQYMGVWQDRE